MKKRLLSLTAAMLLAIFTLSACGSSNSIEGRWSHQGELIEFRSGGLFIQHRRDDDREYGQWLTNGNVLTIDMDRLRSIQSFTFNVNGDRLTITEGTSSQIWQRVR